MTAGAGILHDEVPTTSFAREGGRSHGVQLWVNLPAASKFAPPRYQALPGGELTLLSSADGATLVRLIAGELGGLPLREPIAHYGPFLMNSREQIMEAIEDYNAGRMGRVPAVERSR